MSRVQQKNREANFLEHFKELYPNFPIGDTKPDETPDFILTLKDGSRIGIEVTELFAMNAPEEIDYLKTNQLMLDLVAMAKDKFEASFGISIQAEITFDRKLQCTKTEKSRIALQITEDVIRCYNSVAQLSDVRHYEFDTYILNTPFVEKISLINKPLSIGIWNTGEAVLLRDVLPKELELTIKKKDSKVSDIRKKVQFSWLLIVEPYDKLFFDSWNEIKTVESAFDKIFALRTIENTVIELK